MSSNHHKSFLFKYLSKFISISIYLLMFLVALFVFYKVIILIYYIGFSVYWEIISSVAGDLEFIDGKSWSGIFLIENFLSNITFILILVKAYRILESYAKHHHIEIVDLVEIAIIALIMEVVFNFSVHSLSINILFWAVWVALLVIYASMPYFREKENNI
jgi:uncharacterized membrane protein (DUF373 family)